MIAVGLMSGTSADGVDVAIADIRGTGHEVTVKLLCHYSRSYSSKIRERILRASENGSVAEICHLNVLLGEIFARAILGAIKQSQVSLERVGVIGSHGQTIHHRPIPVNETGIGLIRSTMQIGDPSVIAERTGVLTVSDFRSRDLAVAGEGAPLAPYVHALLLGKKRVARLVLNLGGISNVTVLPKGGILSKVYAFDTGPCNMLLDGLVDRGTNGKMKFDRGGRVALTGQVHPGLLRWLLTHPYITRRPPKSTGREMFGESYLKKVWAQGVRRRLSVADLLATSARFIAQVVQQSRQWTTYDIQEVVVGGGGVRNACLWRELTEAFSPTAVIRMEECGIPSQAFEAQAFAVLAYQTVRGVCGNLPRVTGARRPVILGTVTPGKQGFPKRIFT